MSRLRMLAASARPLADVLIDVLRGSSKLSRLRATLPDEADYSPEQFSLQLDDESNDKRERDTIQVLHPDDAAAAVLLGRAFEPSRDALTPLKTSDMVAIIEVPHPDLVAPIARLLRKHVLGLETPVLDGDSLSKEA